jgi:hypothetical protein
MYEVPIYERSPAFLIFDLLQMASVISSLSEAGEIWVGDVWLLSACLMT